MASPSTLSHLTSRLELLFQEAQAARLFSGAALGVVSGSGSGRQRLVRTYGATGYGPAYPEVGPATFFDLASLTKPLATTLAVLCLLREKKLSLADSLPRLLSDAIPADKHAITLEFLLRHASGLPAHRPYYEELGQKPPAERLRLARDWVLREPLLSAPGSQVIYSDLGFMLLGWIVEEKAGEGLERYVARRVYAPLGLTDRLFFRPLSGETAGGAISYAATEQCAWRGKTVCGEVHDDNAYVLGGVAGHAGLFGTVEAVLELTTHLLEVWRGRSEHPGFKRSDLQAFLTRPVSDSNNTWALGFDTPSPVGSSAGRFLSSRSVGHLGFTGTSFWIDPDRELVMVLLTNRVHPSRADDRIKSFRPLFHETVMEALYGGLPSRSS